MISFTIAFFIQFLVFVFLVGGVLGAWLTLNYDYPKDPPVKRKKKH